MDSKASKDGRKARNIDDVEVEVIRTMNTSMSIVLDNVGQLVSTLKNAASEIQKLKAENDSLKSKLDEADIHSDNGKEKEQG